MKKAYLLLLVAILLSTSLFSQEETNDETISSENFNEFKLNGLYLVLGAFDVTYERTINEESAFGLNVFLPFDDDVNDDVNYYISPYYRFYFGNKYAAGFFVEGFGMLNSINDYRLSSDGFDTILQEENITDFALGIGLGGKWITNSGFIGELNLGFGRNLFNNDRYDYEIIGKIGISVGYRF
ncbi:hypothetical protein BFR04_03525 [Gaetbulibacter sp. 4G1]|nr:DUF3575 domain-containing protein [Gaetbulibacter sp. 4G1]PIA78617.1 hypothetical protein BFR04_03525 [Gaetbulibacter sp. 4G1]